MDFRGFQGFDFLDYTLIWYGIRERVQRASGFGSSNKCHMNFCTVQYWNRRKSRMAAACAGACALHVVQSLWLIESVIISTQPGRRCGERCKGPS